MKARLVDGRLFLLEDAQRVMGDRVLAVRAALLNLPDRLATAIIDIDNEPVRGILQREIAEMVENLPTYDPTIFRNSNITYKLEENEEENDQVYRRAD